MIVDRASDAVYDVAIIGAGPAGISLALKLSQDTNLRILLVDSGALELNASIQQLSEVQAVGDLPAAHYRAHSVRSLGGTSLVWGGFCSMLEERSFERGEWPITYDEIEGYYVEAAQILELYDGAFEEPYLPLGTGDSIVFKPVYLSSVRFDRNFKEKYEDLLRDSARIDVLLGTACTGVIFDGSRVESIQLSRSRSGNEFQVVKSRSFVLACGGVGNVKLLQATDLDSGPALGAYLMEHPHIYSAGMIQVVADLIPLTYERSIADKIVNKVVGGNQGIRYALALSDGFCLENDILNFTVEFKIENVERRLFLGDMREMYVSDAIIRAEMYALEENRVYQGQGDPETESDQTQVDFRFRYKDVGTKSWRLFSNELLKHGIGRASGPLVALETSDERGQITGGGHLMGATRMGHFVETSTVDRNCKMHNYDNMYIAGSSIFSAGGASHPTYSIVAFALRLADHLATSMNAVR